jgi:hypothetical protein
VQSHWAPEGDDYNRAFPVLMSLKPSRTGRHDYHVAGDVEATDAGTGGTDWYGALVHLWEDEFSEGHQHFDSHRTPAH